MGGILINGDGARLPIASRSVHCVIFSPPYWGHREYQGNQTRGLFPDLGLEMTMGLHISRMVEIGHEVRRILRPDGVWWLNYGDGFSTTVNGRPAVEISQFGDDRAFRDKPFSTNIDLPAGNLLMLPHRIAIALQEDGWIIRNDNVWPKANPMPESLPGVVWKPPSCDCAKEARERLIAEQADQGIARHRVQNRAGKILADPNCERCGGTGKLPGLKLTWGAWRHTRAHEFVFMLTKTDHYFCDQRAVREPYSRKVRKEEAYLQRLGGRNPRTVFRVKPEKYGRAHYATYPQDLIWRLIRAATPKYCCPECGQGWAPVVDETFSLQGDVSPGRSIRKPGAKESRWKGYPRGRTHSTVTGYLPTCEHDLDPIPGIVVDPFIGSGTTGLVAEQLGVRWIGVDIAYEYLDEHAKVRALKKTPSHALDDLPLFNAE